MCGNTGSCHMNLNSRELLTYRIQIINENLLLFYPNLESILLLALLQLQNIDGIFSSQPE